MLNISYKCMMPTIWSNSLIVVLVINQSHNRKRKHRYSNVSQPVIQIYHSLLIFWVLCMVRTWQIPQQKANWTRPSHRKVMKHQKRYATFEAALDIHIDMFRFLLPPLIWGLNFIRFYLPSILGCSRTVCTVQYTITVPGAALRYRLDLQTDKQQFSHMLGFLTNFLISSLGTSRPSYFLFITQLNGSFSDRNRRDWTWTKEAQW